MRAKFDIQSATRTIVSIQALLLASFASDAWAQTKCDPPPAGLVSWWQAESNALDSVGANNGVFTNSSFATGEVRSAFNFDGSGNSIRVPASASLNLGTSGGLTIEAWIDSTDNTYGRPIVEWVSKTVGGYGVHFFAHLGLPGTLYADLYDTENNHHILQSTAGLVLTNVFQHVAVTYDKASGIGRLLINGAVVAESALGTFTPQTSPDLAIGYRANTTPFGPIPFIGLIDEVSLYSRALSPAELLAIFSAGRAGKCTGPINCTPAPSGLVSWWQAESNAVDSVGANNGVFTNSSFATGEVGGAFNFDGSGNNIRVPASASLDLGTGGGLTIEAWIDSTDNTYGRPIVEWVSKTVGGYGVHFFAHVALPGTLYADLFDTANNHHILQSAAGLVLTNVFQHVAVTYDKASGIGRLLINGTVVAESALGTFTPLTSPDLAIGYRPNTTPFGPIPFVGLIDEVSLYSRALSPTELLAIFTAGRAGKCVGQQTNCTLTPAGLVSWWPAEGNVFDIVSGNNATQTNGITFEPGLVNLGLNFDGTTSAVTVPASPSLNLSNLTIETWIFPTDASTPRPIFEYGDSTGLSALNFWYNIGTGAQPVPGALFGFARDGQNPNNNFYLASNAGLVPANQWSHVAFTFDSETGSAVLYVNGTNVATTSFNGPIHPNTRLAVNLGYRPVGSADLYAGFRHAGKLDETSLYNRVLAQSEIQAIYLAGSAGKCTTPRAPAIVLQPTNESITLGGNATFAVLATGTPPLNYQWFFGGSSLSGATASTLAILNAQFADAGSYAVIVSNTFGAVTSSIAALNVSPACAPAPAGLVSWWQAQSNALDFTGGNNGQLQTEAGFAPGRVGTAFSFDGLSSKVDLGDPMDLAFTNSFSIEGWIWIKGFPAADQGHGLILYRGDPRFCLDPYYLGTRVNGNLRFHIEDEQNTIPCGMDLETGPVPTAQWLHVASVFDDSNGSMQVYVNGQLVAQTNTVIRPFQTLSGGGTSIGNLSVGQNGMSFNGLIDELSVYDRALTTNEIQSIYNASSAGKCSEPIPPSIVSQPAGQVVDTGGAANFLVVAAGSIPLKYQWTRNGAALNGATSSTLTIHNLRGSDAGSYAVTVSNAVGTVTSSNISLVVNPPPCQPPPSGLVAWWKGDHDANDSIGGHTGVLKNDTGFAAGEVGQAFDFNGVNQFIEIPDSPSLNPANALTLETWVYVSGNPNTDLATIITKFSPSDAQLNQYQLETHYDGLRLNFRSLILLPSGYGYVDGETTVQFNTWYHVAMTYDGSSLKLYVNGSLDGSVAASGRIAPTAMPLRIGGPGDGPWWFKGRVDEVSLYDRALSLSEVQAIYAADVSGKCAELIPPSFVTQPQSQSGLAGSTVTFSAAAAGSIPLYYQWLFNGTPVPGATTNSLTLNNISKTVAGSYSVAVTNAAGSITSSVAVLTVSKAPVSIQVAGATVSTDGKVTVPVNLVANGDENAVSFSLNFNPNLLTYDSVVLAGGSASASLLLNSSQAAAGQLGVAVGLPAGVTFGADSQQLVIVSFNSPIVTHSTSTPIGFGDAPIKRLVTDASGGPLDATYVSGSVILPPTEIEGDVYPRPEGDGALTISDWVLVGRYVARLDFPTNAAEFQRADCAPRTTLGDGDLTVSDWVQAGRYAAGLDSMTRIGGPTSPVPAVVGARVGSAITRKTQSNTRQVKGIAPVLAQGQVGIVEIALEAQGDENALAFSLSFDPAKLTFIGASAGDAANGAALNINANQANQGRLGVVLSLKANQSFAAGSKQLVKVSFRAIAQMIGNVPVSFSDQPIPRGISDSNASALIADYIDTAVVVNPRFSLKITQSATSFTLSWPASATNYVLQESSNPSLTAGSWTSVQATATVKNNENQVVIPVSGTNRFYRLYHP